MKTKKIPTLSEQFRAKQSNLSHIADETTFQNTQQININVKNVTIVKCHDNFSIVCYGEKVYTVNVTNSININ